MKWKTGIVCMWLAGLASVMTVQAQGTNGVATTIGVYDSRAVAYAWFWSPAQQAKLKEQTDAARAAKTVGDPVKYKELGDALRAGQDEMHRQVFSTAPAKEALATLRDQLPEIEKAAGVIGVVSKWDKASLKQHPVATEIDVTDAMVRALLKPTEKQAKAIEDLKKSVPMPLEKCNDLIRQGKM